MTLRRGLRSRSLSATNKWKKTGAVPLGIQSPIEHDSPEALRRDATTFAVVSYVGALLGSMPPFYVPLGLEGPMSAIWFPFLLGLSFYYCLGLRVALLVALLLTLFDVLFCSSNIFTFYGLPCNLMVDRVSRALVLDDPGLRYIRTNETQLQLFGFFFAAVFWSRLPTKLNLSFWQSMPTLLGLAIGIKALVLLKFLFPLLTSLIAIYALLRFGADFRKHVSHVFSAGLDDSAKKYFIKHRRPPFEVIPEHSMPAFKAASQSFSTYNRSYATHSSFIQSPSGSLWKRLLQAFVTQYLFAHAISYVVALICLSSREAFEAWLTSCSVFITLPLCVLGPMLLMGVVPFLLVRTYLQVSGDRLYRNAFHGPETS